MIIKTWRDPYEAGFSPTQPKEIELKSGLTVLVGCNGAGKSTLLNNIDEHCRKNNIPHYKYDNLSDGGSSAISEMVYNQNYSEVNWLMSASEGEAIKSNFGRLSNHFYSFVDKGYIENNKTRFSRIFSKEEELKKKDQLAKESKERVLLFDAVDSGLSVDSVVEIKAIFDKMLEDTKDFNKDIYIIIAANEFELARNVPCFDVNTGKYVYFGNDYMAYRKFIIDSRIRKEKRLAKQQVWYQKKHDKELADYIKLKTEIEPKIQEILNKYDGKKPTYTNNYSDARALDNLEQKLKDFVRHAQYISEKEFIELDNKNNS